MAKKLLAIFLTVLLVACLVFPVGVSAEKAEDFCYVALGASTANGYGMRYYFDKYFYDHPTERAKDLDESGYRNNVEGSYPDLIRDEFEKRGYNVDYNQLSQSSMRIEELRFLLDKDYKGDEYTAWRFYNSDKHKGWWINDLESLREDYKKSVEKADLITLDLGINNFGVYISNQMLDGLYGHDFSKIVDKKYADKFYAFRDEIHELIGKLVDDTSALDEIENVSDTFAYALLGYIINFDAVVEKIRDLNPDCDIIVLGIQNPMSDVYVTLKGIKFSFGDLYSIPIGMANRYVTSKSSHRNEYYYADIANGGHVSFFLDQINDYNGDPATITQEMKDCFDLYDTRLYASTRAAEQLKNEGVTPEENAQVLTAVYDSLMKAIKKCVAVESMPLDPLIDGMDIDAVTDDLMSAFKGIITESASAKLSALRGGPAFDYDAEARVSEVLNDDAHKLVAAFYMRSYLGNTFLTHPSPKGHQETAETVLYTYDKKITCKKARTIKYITKQVNVVKNTFSYGNSMLKSLGETIKSIDIKVYKAATAPITSFAGRLFDIKKSAKSEYISPKLDFSSLGSVTASAVAVPEKSAHSHNATLHTKKPATCTENGLEAHYCCEACGKYFKDRGCTQEVTFEELVIAAKGHRLMHVKAHNPTFFSIGNTEYYVCTVCGAMFEDAEGTKPITDRTQVIVPIIK